MKLTECPPEPSEQDKVTFYHGISDGGQFARKHKKTGEVELWWTGGNGRWGTYCGGMDTSFTWKPRMKMEVDSE